jgi:hypothetical protein
MISFFIGKYDQKCVYSNTESETQPGGGSHRVSGLTSCGHDREWYDSLKDRVQSNVAYIHSELEYGGQYCKTILNYEGQSDIVIVDGRDRVNLAMHSLGTVKHDGVII